VPYSSHLIGLVTNATVRDTNGCPPPVSFVVQERRLRFFGHVEHEARSAAGHWCITSRTPRGRPCTTWLRRIGADVQSASFYLYALRHIPATVLRLAIRPSSFFFFFLFFFFFVVVVVVARAHDHQPSPGWVDLNIRIQSAWRKAVCSGDNEEEEVPYYYSLNAKHSSGNVT